MLPPHWKNLGVADVVKPGVLFVSPVENLVGTHDAPIRCVEYCPEVNVMVTGSWDQTVKLWDPRTPCNAGTFSQPEKVGSCSSAASALGICCPREDCVLTVEVEAAQVYFINPSA